MTTLQREAAKHVRQVPGPGTEGHEGLGHLHKGGIATAESLTDWLRWLGWLTRLGRLNRLGWLNRLDRLGRLTRRRRFRRFRQVRQ